MLIYALESHHYGMYLGSRSVRLHPELFVVGLMSYLRYLGLFANSGVQHILCCVFLCLMLPVSLDCSFGLPIRYSLTFIYSLFVYWSPNLFSWQLMFLSFNSNTTSAAT